LAALHYPDRPSGLLARSTLWRSPGYLGEQHIDGSENRALLMVVTAGAAVTIVHHTPWVHRRDATCNVMKAMVL